MSHVRRFDHVGLTVADLDVVTAFFVALGLQIEGRTFVEGEFLDTVCGIPGSRTEIVMLKPPGDGTRLELSSFVRPGSVPGSPAAMANELGLRNVAFEVSDLQAAVDWATTEGYGLVGGIGEYEGAWRMAYVRGAGGDHRLAGRAHRLSLATPASAAEHAPIRRMGPIQSAEEQKRRSSLPTSPVHYKPGSLQGPAQARHGISDRGHPVMASGHACYEDLPAAAAANTARPRRRPHI